MCCLSEGVIDNNIGRSSLVLEMINNLGQGVLTPSTTIYHNTVKKLDNHCNKCCRKQCVTLKKVYFSDCWVGTATVAAAVLLLLTMAATGASIYQAIKTKP